MSVECRYRRNRGNSRSPNFIIQCTKTCYLPGLLCTYVANLVENVWWCGSVRDEDVIGQEFDSSVHMLRRINKSK